MQLTEKQKRFCEEYIYDWNASRAYSVAYPDAKSDSGIRASASQLLTNPNIQAYIKEAQVEIERLAKISRLKVLEEYQKIAFTSIADYHNTWIERKDFESLTTEQKSAIAEIQTRTSYDQSGKPIEEVKIKLHDKHKALESISKMLGYNEPDRVDHKVSVDQITGFDVK